LSQFYDGVKIFDYKVAEFWPLLITILNLPATLRNQPGVGTFLLSILTNKPDCPAEKYLFINCFVEELKVLEKGIVINDIYFVQVRLIQHCLDTKAVGKQLNVHETNSVIGCPLCRDLPGSYRNELEKCVYSGVRYLLPHDNWSRFAGRTRVCCPPWFYGTCADNAVKHKSDNIEAYNAYSELDLKLLNDNLLKTGNFDTPYQQRLMKSDNLKSCVPNSDDNNLRIIQFNSAKSAKYQWYHNKIDVDDDKNPYFHGSFSGQLYFVHCDIRPQVDLKRRTQDEFDSDGVRAEELSKLRIPLKNRHVNGIKGRWPFSRLPYANIKYDMCFDSFHCIFGMCRHFIQILKGERSNSKLDKYCQATKTFPFLYNDNKNVPWVLSKTEALKIDAWIDAILVPKSYNDQFQLDRLFQATGYVRGKSHIDTFSILINYLNLSLPAQMPQAYKNFFSMFGSIISELLSFSVCPTNIEELHFKFIETMAVYEGLFSEKECNFIFHESLHLARHITIMGPLNGWWTFAGERTNSFVKSFVPKTGGRSFDKSCMNAYNSSEEAITETAFGAEFYAKDKRITFNEVTQQLEFDFDVFYFFSPKTFRKPYFFPEFSGIEKESLLNVLLSEIYKTTSNHYDALQRSSLYRIYDQYCIIIKNNNKINKQQPHSFHYWLNLVRLFLDNGERKTQITDNNTQEQFLLGQIENLIRNNTFKENEIKTASSIMDLIEFQTLTMYKNAYIYGNRFSARDESYSEKFEMVKDNSRYGSTTNSYKYNNEKNNLNILKNWSSKDDYSSWCRYRLLNYTTNTDNNGSFSISGCKDYYGRLNYFFRCFCETDDIVHGLGIANIVPCTFEKKNLVDKISCKEYKVLTKQETNDSKITFVPVTNIYATPILIAPFDESDKPIVISTNKILLKQNLLSETNQISHIYAIDLIPNDSKDKIFQQKKYKIYNNYSKDLL
jgi:hypothetical protein